jgi:hypothetical protein
MVHREARAPADKSKPGYTLVRYKEGNVEVRKCICRIAEHRSRLY